MVIDNAYRFVYNGQVREFFVTKEGVAKRGGQAFVQGYCRQTGGFKTFHVAKCESITNMCFDTPLDTPEKWPVEAVDAAMAAYSR